MCEQCNAPAFEWRAQSGFSDKSIIAKFHGRYALGKLKRKGIGMMEICLASQHVAHLDALVGAGQPPDHLLRRV
jgi:hypothetical protein